MIKGKGKVMLGFSYEIIICGEFGWIKCGCWLLVDIVRANDRQIAICAPISPWILVYMNWILKTNSPEWDDSDNFLIRHSIISNFPTMYQFLWIYQYTAIFSKDYNDGNYVGLFCIVLVQLQYYSSMSVHVFYVLLFEIDIILKMQKQGLNIMIIAYCTNGV